MFVSSLFKTVKMKHMKNILTLLLLVIVSNTAIAQERELTDEQKTQMETQLTEYFEKLDLSEDQKTKFEEITKKYNEQMRGLRDSDKGRLDKYKELKSIRKNKNKEMNTLLSNEQYKTYEETQEKMQQKMKEKRKNKR